jgi:hypothetical protein
MAWDDERLWLRCVWLLANHVQLCLFNTHGEEP